MHCCCWAAGQGSERCKPPALERCSSAAWVGQRRLASLQADDHNARAIGLWFGSVSRFVSAQHSRLQVCSLQGYR